MLQAHRSHPFAAGRHPDLGLGVIGLGVIGLRV